MKLVLLFALLVGCSRLPVKLEAPKKEQKVLTLAWAKNLDAEYVSGNLPIGVGAPRVFNDIVYMGSLSGTMSAFDQETGRVLWKADEKTPLGGPVEFFNDHVAYGGQSGRLFVRHYLTGALKYAIDLSAPVESAPFYHKGHLFVYLRGHQIVHLDAETGKIIWAYKRAVPVTTTLQRTTRPLIIGNKVIVGFADGFLGALSLAEGVVIWETKLIEQGKFVDVDLNPIFVNGSVISGSPSGELKAVNPDNGAITRSFDVSVQAHPFVKGSQLILGSNDGEIILMGLNGEILKKAQISKKAISSVTWWKELIIATSFEGYLYAIDPLTMNVVDKFALGYDFSAVYSDLITTQDFLTFYTSRNRLYVFK